jgi:hypothetical protein
MDINSIANLPANLTQAGLNDQAGTAVLKKALDIEATSAVALIQSLPQPAAPVNLPAHLGRNIDTTA